MAIERFQNKDILVSSKVPVSNVKVYSLTDESNLGAVTLQLESNDLVHSTTTSVGATSIVSSQNQLRRSISGIGGTTYNFETKVESHIYSADTLVSSNESELVYESNNTDTDRKVDILINPERDVRLSNIETGYYSLVYNFVKNLTPELKVLNINADSTEIELEVKGSGNLGKLLQRISQNEDELNSFVDYWRDKVDIISVQKFMPPTTDKEKYKQYYASDQYHELPVESFNCVQPYQRIMFRNEFMYPCCVSFNNDLKLGSIHTQTIYSAWHSDKMKKIRELHRKGEYHKNETCKNCVNLIYPPKEKSN